MDMIKANNPCTYIDGIGSSQAIDTAGEIVDLKGLDISSLVGAAFNWEHNKDLPAQIVGKVLEAHKIFSKEDCQNDRQLFYWEKCQIPFLYVMGRLFDDRKPSSVEVAALFKDDAAHPNESDMVGFSIEGAKVEKVGAVVTRSIARKCTITHIPANKTCIAEMLPMVKDKKDDIDSLFKGEMELFKFEPSYQEIMEKKEKDLSKDVGSGGGAFIGSAMACAEGWQSSASQDGMSVSARHKTHGEVKTSRTKHGSYEVHHNSKLVGVTPNLNHATKFISGYTQKFAMSEDMSKAMDAGSSLGAAPSQLTQGAALGREGMMKKLHKKEKSKHYERADQAYQNWGDREKFKGYMKKRMPHLADGEIDAFGRVLALKKDMDKEKSLSKMYSSYFGKKEVLEKEETGHEKGVHAQSPSQKPGISAMGQQVRHAKNLSDKGKAGYGGHFKANFTAKMHSENKLKQARGLSAPKLTKSTDIMMAAEDDDKDKKKQ